MASYQVLSAPEPTGFLSGLAKGLPQATNMYAEAALKDAFERKKKDREKAERARELKDFQTQFGGEDDLDFEYSFGSDGAKYSAKPKDKMKAMKETLAGFGDPGSVGKLGKQYGIANTNVPAPDAALDLNYDGQLGLAVPYEDQVRKALLGDYTQEQVRADAMGLPQIKEEQIPPAFEQEAKAAYDSAAGDETVFLNNLKALAQKYPTNKAVLNLIKEQMNIATKKGEDELNAAYGF